MNKEELKKYLNLDETLLITQFAAKLKPYAQIIYWVGAGILAFLLLVALVKLLTGLISVGILSMAWVFVQFIVLRMFCEFLKIAN